MTAKDDHDVALTRATEVFGDETRAAEWLEKMAAGFDMSPAEMLAREGGLDRVLRHLRSVEFALRLD